MAEIKTQIQPFTSTYFQGHRFQIITEHFDRLEVAEQKQRLIQHSLKTRTSIVNKWIELGVKKDTNGLSMGELAIFAYLTKLLKDNP